MFSHESHANGIERELLQISMTIINENESIYLKKAIKDPLYVAIVQ